MEVGLGVELGGRLRLGLGLGFRLVGSWAAR